MILEEKGIPYQYIECNPYHKPESLLKLNPRGLVPTLQYNNKPLYESTVICEFLAEAYPNHGLKLLPEDPYLRAYMRIWIDFVSTRIIPAFHRFLQFQSIDSTIDTVRAEFLQTLKSFTEAMDQEGPFFSGSEPMLIDFVVAPWALRLWIFDHFKGGLGMPDDDTWARWRSWFRAIESRQSIENTTSEKEHFLPIYQR